MFDIQFQIAEIFAKTITEYKEILGVVIEDEDEIYFLVSGGNASGELSDVSKITRIPSDDDGLDIKQGSSLKSIDLKQFSLNDGEIGFLNVTLGEDDLFDLINIVEGLVTLGTAIAKIYAGITGSGNPGDILTQIPNVVKGGEELYKGITDADDPLGGFNVGVSNKDGKPEFIWEPGQDTKLVASDDDEALFEATGSGANYLFRVKAEILDTIQSALTSSLEGTSTKNLILLGNDAISGTGNSLDNIITGNEANNTLSGLAGNDSLYGRGGNDTLIGGAGSDSMFGGTGDDTYEVDNSADIITELANEGTDTVNSSISYTLSDNVEYLTLTGNNSINGTGNSLNNIITGNSANNTLNGLAGNDTLNGGGGDDLLVGEAGNDLIDGGSDIDTVSYANSLSSVIVNIDETRNYNNPSADLEPTFVINAGTATDGFGTQDTLRNLENIIGSQFNDILIGNSQNNQILGLAGNDLLIGNAGNDYLDGGDGFDTVSYRRDPGRVTINLGLNTVSDGFGGTDQIFNIENVVGSDFGNTIIGDNRDNTLTGGNGNDEIAGGAGNDRIFGEGGNDTLLGEDGDDTLIGGSGTGWPSDILNGGAGNDTASYITATSGVAASLEQKQGWMGDATGDQFISIENLEGSNYDDFLIGDNGANILSGLAGNDTLEGRDGDDTLDGGEGNNILNAGEGNNTVTAGSGNDTVYAGAGNDTISTNGGNDQIYAGDGNNTINAGEGTNKIYAGTGYDYISAGAGNDEIYAGNGGSTICALAMSATAITGIDFVITSASRDIIVASSGIDFISTLSSVDRVIAVSSVYLVVATISRDSIVASSSVDGIVT
jgi:Ca2+-binding RTX toxin-like protein